MTSDVSAAWQVEFDALTAAAYRDQRLAAQAVADERADLRKELRETAAKLRTAEEHLADVDDRKRWNTEVGREAEQLRRGIERALEQDDAEDLRAALRRLLDDVDARDSLASLTADRRVDVGCDCAERLSATARTLTEVASTARGDMADAVRARAAYMRDAAELVRGWHGAAGKKECQG